MQYYYYKHPRALPSNVIPQSPQNQPQNGGPPLNNTQVMQIIQLIKLNDQLKSSMVKQHEKEVKRISLTLESDNDDILNQV